MYLLIENNRTGDAQRVPLARRELWIGRALDDARPSADITVASRLLAIRDLHLRLGDDGWHLTQHGDNPAQLNDRMMDPRRDYPLRPGDCFSTPGYLFSLLEETGSTGSSLASVSGSSELFRIQRRLHDVLRQRVKAAHRGRDDLLDNLDSPDLRAEVRAELERIIAEPELRIEDAQIDLLSEAAMYLRLNRRVILAGTNVSGSIDSAVRQTRAFEAQLVRLEQAMAVDLGLECALRSMQHDLAQMDARFTVVFQRHRLSLDAGLRRFLVESLIIRDLEDLIFGLGPLQDLQEATAVSEIMVANRERIFAEKAGVIEDTRRMFFSDEALMLVIQRIVAPLGKSIDRSSPLVDARLADGSRVNAVIPPIAVKGPALTIRKFSKKPIDVGAMEHGGAFSPTMTRFLRACVQARKNIVISGGTGSGKTTLLNALTGFVDPRQRIVTIEDTAELQIPLPHVIAMEARPPNMEGKGEITLKDLVKNALRMRPDRIIVGECRGAEAIDMLQAMNTGHSGSMTTGHANTPQDMMRRLETMVLMGVDMPTTAIREQIASAVDVVVQLSRAEDGVRRVTHISEVTGIDEVMGHLIVEDIFTFLPTPVSSDAPRAQASGEHLHTGYMPIFMGELIDKGLLDLACFFGTTDEPGGLEAPAQGGANDG